MRIKTPTTIDEATTRLHGIGQLITATEWERAAIVATFVRLDVGHGGRDETDSNGRFLSARAFADMGVSGLRSHMTVSMYVKRWLELGNGHPAPGKSVTLPHRPWAEPVPVIEAPPSGPVLVPTEHQHHPSAQPIVPFVPPRDSYGVIASNMAAANVGLTTAALEANRNPALDELQHEAINRAIAQAESSLQALRVAINGQRQPLRRVL